MTDANDLALVREFAGRNSEQAFAELVRRHLNLVYSVAMRYTGNTGDAQDVAQAVFVTLARKAAGLSTRTVLTGWLYETTRFTASRLLRTQARRRAHEYEASMQSNLDDPGYDDVWRQLAPHLEAAMSRLGERDRTLLALRYYQNMTGAEAAAQLGIHEEAARKRTNRALEKLRRYFAQHGVNSTPAIIARAIASNSIQAAPAGLAKTISAVAVAKAATASTSTLTLSKGALKIMAWTKTKTAIAAAVVVALIGTGGVGGYTVFRAYHSPTNLMASSWYIQPDGICHVLVTMKIINTSGKAIGVNDSEPLGMGLNIDQITDETGRAIKFTKDPGDKGSPFRYSYTLNRPIPPGGTLALNLQGTIDGLALGLIKAVGKPDVFEYQDREQPGGDPAIRRQDVYRLPPGAELLEKEPADLLVTTNGGLIEAHFDKQFPPARVMEVRVRYRLAATAN